MGMHEHLGPSAGDTEANERRTETGRIRVKDMEPMEQQEIDRSSAMVEAADASEHYGINGRILVSIQAGDMNYMIADVARDPRFPVSTIIMDGPLQPDESGQITRGYVPVSTGEFVNVGRLYHADQLSYSDEVSRRHFAVSLKEGNPVVHNYEPANGTHLVWYEQAAAAPVKSEHDASRTQMAVDRIRDSADYRGPDAHSPYGYYVDRQIIGRDTQQIEGGVYLGGTAREAVTVDGDSPALREVYRGLLGRIQESPPSDMRGVLVAIKDVVSEAMPYDADKAEAISEAYYGDKLIDLGEYVRQQAGVCRHQNLLAAWLAEKLVHDGILPPAGVAVERNTVPDMGGTHAWATFKGGEEPIVIDASQDFVGTKQEARDRGLWEYSLPTDLPYAPKVE